MEQEFLRLDEGLHIDGGPYGMGWTAWIYDPLVEREYLRLLGLTGRKSVRSHEEHNALLHMACENVRHGLK